MIGYDHPFVDGNGRTAGALFNWAMARFGYWLADEFDERLRDLADARNVRRVRSAAEGLRSPPSG